MPFWSQAQQRVLWVMALLLLTLAAVRLSNSVDAEPDFRPLEDDPHLDLRLDLNRATEYELQALPGIGVTLASRIAEYRRRNGPFRKVSTLTNVRGIGEKKLRAVLPYLSAPQRGESKVSAEDVIRGRREGGAERRVPKSIK